MISLADIDACDNPDVLRSWWRTLPTRTDEERDVVERLAVRMEGLGMVAVDGKLVGKG